MNKLIHFLFYFSFLWIILLSPNIHAFSSVVSKTLNDEKNSETDSLPSLKLKALPNLSSLLSSSLFERNFSTKSISSVSTLEDLQTSAIQLHYMEASQIVNLIKPNNLGLLSAKGKADADSKLNILWIHDYPSNIKKLNQILKIYDQPSPQIYIKAKIINIDSNYLRSLGLTFNTDQGLHDSDGGINGVIIPIAELGHDVLLEATLDALEKSGHAKLISDPQLITLDRQTATIEAGEEVPYQETTYSGGTSVSFKKAVLSLQVTPVIMPQNRILLNLKINQDQVSSLAVNGVPAINTQEITTQAYVKDKSTLILGGIFEQTHSIQQNGIPGLSRVPVVGGLFHHQDRVNNHSQLLILVTPVIVNL